MERDAPASVVDMLSMCIWGSFLSAGTGSRPRKPGARADRHKVDHGPRLRRFCRSYTGLDGERRGRRQGQGSRLFADPDRPQPDSARSPGAGAGAASACSQERGRDAETEAGTGGRKTRHPGAGLGQRGREKAGLYRASLEPEAQGRPHFRAHPGTRRRSDGCAAGRLFCGGGPRVFRRSAQRGSGRRDALLLQPCQCHCRGARFAVHSENRRDIGPHLHSQRVRDFRGPG